MDFSALLRIALLNLTYVINVTNVLKVLKVVADEAGGTLRYTRCHDYHIWGTENRC